MNDSESYLPIESEIAGHATDLILVAYDRNLTPLWDYNWLGQEPITALDQHYDNENLEYIVGTIRKALRELMPDCDVLVEPESLKRMVWQVFGALKLHPIKEKDKKGNVRVYHPDPLLSEVFDEPSDAIEHHNRIKNHLETLLWEMNKELSDHILARFESLEDFYNARSDTQKNNARWIILQCGIDIRRGQEKIRDFCEKNDMPNPFDSSHDISSWVNSTPSDTPYLNTLSQIFALSKPEKFLRKFLPEGTIEEEPYLFNFFLDDADVFDEASFEQHRFSIYEKIYERKLLIFFYASTQLHQAKEASYFETKQKLSDLSFEIKACQRSVDSFSDEAESRDDIAENDISRINILYQRVMALRRKYSAVQVGYDISQVFYTISQSLQLFIDTVKSRLSTLETSEEQKEEILASLRRTLHITLQHSWNQLGDSQEEAIVSMRRILNEALEFLVHD